MSGTGQEAYVEAVLTVVERIPHGRVTTYGSIAEHVRQRLGRGGPRQVGTVMSQHGGPVPWWRVVHADGSPPTCHDGQATRLQRSEGIPHLPSGRVDMRAAFWHPDDDPA